MPQSKQLFFFVLLILIFCKADKYNPLDYLKDTFAIVRPFSVSEDKNEKVAFHCKPAKGDQFDKCMFKTPFNKTYQAQKDGGVIDVETNEIVPGVSSFLESNGQLVCGLQIAHFTPENYGWWSCHLDNSGPVHIGTFKINQPGEWPTDIRLKNEFTVNKIINLFILKFISKCTF